MIPSHWHIDRLKWTVTECRNGIWGDESDGINDLACVRVADFDRTRFVVQSEIPTVRAVAPSQRAGRMLKKGDLLLEKSGGGDLQPVGAVVLFDHHIEAVCSNFVARMPVAAGYDGRFLSYLHAALYTGRLNARSIKQTTGIQNLDSYSYLNERAAHPPLDEQRAIAAFLDRESGRIDELIAKKQRLIELLAEKRTALINHAVIKGLNPDAPMKDSGVRWLARIPTHWSVCRLKCAFHFLNNKRVPISGEDRAVMAKEYPYYGASGIIDHVDDYIFDEPLILVAEDGANLFSRSTPLAFVARGKYWVNNHAHILRPKRGPIRFWEAVLRTVQYDPWITGSAQPKLTKEAIGDIPLPMPPSEEQDEIAAFIEASTDRLDPLSDRVSNAIERIREYRSALVSASVTGKIDVRGEAQ